MTQPRTVTIGLCQHAAPPPPESTPAQNLAKAIEMIRDAAGRGAQLVATQELFTGHYFPQVEDGAMFALAEPIPGPTTQALGELAKELDIEISASIFEQRVAGVYHNTSVMIGPDGQVHGRYRKMHIPDDPRFYEKYYFTPGDAASGDGQPAGFAAHNTRHAKAGMLVCWDQWYPEAARLTAMRGAEILFYPTAIAWHKEENETENRRQRAAWQTIQRSHAIANGVYVASINRTGVEGDLTFWGSSFVADPFGEVIAEAPVDEDAVLVVECDLGVIDRQRTDWPFFRDRRIDAYGGLTQRMLDESP